MASNTIACIHILSRTLLVPASWSFCDGVHPCSVCKVIIHDTLLSLAFSDKIYSEQTNLNTSRTLYRRFQSLSLLPLNQVDLLSCLWMVSYFYVHTYLIHTYGNPPNLEFCNIQLTANTFHKHLSVTLNDSGTC